MPQILTTYGAHGHDHFYSVPSIRRELELSSSEWSEANVVNSGTSALTGMAMSLSSGADANSTVVRKTGGETAITRGSRFDKIDFSKPITIWCRFTIQANTTNGVSQFTIGKDNNDAAVNLDKRGICIFRVADLALIVTVHDGTDLAAVDLNTTLTAFQVYDMRVESDGTGNVTWYLDDAPVGTSSAGPSTESASTDDSNWQMEVLNGADSAAQALAIFNVQWEG